MDCRYYTNSTACLPCLPRHTPEYRSDYAANARACRWVPFLTLPAYCLFLPVPRLYLPAVSACLHLFSTCLGFSCSTTACHSTILPGGLCHHRLCLPAITTWVGHTWVSGRCSLVTTLYHSAPRSFCYLPIPAAATCLWDACSWCILFWDGTCNSTCLPPVHSRFLQITIWSTIPSWDYLGLPFPAVPFLLLGYWELPFWEVECMGDGPAVHYHHFSLHVEFHLGWVSIPADLPVLWAYLNLGFVLMEPAAAVPFRCLGIPPPGCRHYHRCWACLQWGGAMGLPGEFRAPGSPPGILPQTFLEVFWVPPGQCLPACCTVFIPACHSAFSGPPAASCLRNISTACDYLPFWFHSIRPPGPAVPTWVHATTTAITIFSPSVSWVYWVSYLDAISGLGSLVGTTCCACCRGLLGTWVHLEEVTVPFATYGCTAAGYHLPQTAWCVPTWVYHRLGTPGIHHHRVNSAACLGYWACSPAWAGNRATACLGAGSPPAWVGCVLGGFVTTGHCHHHHLLGADTPATAAACHLTAFYRLPFVATDLLTGARLEHLHTTIPRTPAFHAFCLQWEVICILQDRLTFDYHSTVLDTAVAIPCHLPGNLLHHYGCFGHHRSDSCCYTCHRRFPVLRDSHSCRCSTAWEHYPQTQPTHILPAHGLPGFVLPPAAMGGTSGLPLPGCTFQCHLWVPGRFACLVC